MPYFFSSEQIIIRHEWRAQMVKSELQKDVHSLELRKLEKDVFDLDFNLQAYLPQSCIDLWLLKHGICSICNYTFIQSKEKLLFPFVRHT